ncbi:hypothetical protein GCM10010992_20040 [Cloacibacterium rupense]|uniref:Histidine kinase n=2 Tax=Cloacibacterium rupense TaxID=517423 RepID=A0ABQ2NJR2_9FLAO|nr:hypothetical protein GCM10010992_20040 [Cloacibacterium rupense]
MVLVFEFVFSQPQYDKIIYDSYNGFTNTLNDLVQDEEKMLWLSTEDGLWKFDGYNPVRIKNRYERETGRSAIKSIVYKGYIYTIFTERGCISYNLTTGEEQLLTLHEVHDISIEGNKIYLLLKNLDILIIRDHQQTLYKTGFKRTVSGYKRASIVVKNGVIFLSIPLLGFYKIEDNNLMKYSHVEGALLPGGVFGEHFKIYSESIFYSGLKYPIVIRKNNIVSQPLKGLVYHRINDFDVFQGKRYFIKDSKSVYLERGVGQYELIMSIENVELRKILVDGQHIYIATNQGLIDVVKKQDYLVNLKDDVFSQRFRVRRKIIAQENGLYLFSNPNILWYGQDQTLKRVAQPALSVYDAAKVEGGFLLGTEGKGLLFAHQDFTNFKSILPSDSNNPVCTVYYDPRLNRVYAGDYHYLYLINDYGKPAQKIIKVPNLFNDKMIKAVAIDEENNRILVGTDGGMFVVNGKNLKYVKFNIRNRIIGDILIDKGQKLAYIGDDKGLSILRLKDLRIVKQLAFDFMYPSKITGLLQDEKGRLWASTYSGIVGYDYAKDLMINLRKKNGLMNTEYNYKAKAKMQDGRLIFGGLNGYDIINPQKMNFSLNKEKGVVSGYHLIGKDSLYRKMMKDESISYRGDTYYSRLYLSVPSTLQRHQCTFEYRVNQGAWNALKDRYYIDFIGLSADVYHIEVRGSDELGKKIPFQPITIKVKESFYESSYFIVGSLILIFSLAILVFYLTNRNLNVKNEIYERVSMDLHDEVGTVLSKTSLILQYFKTIDDEQKNKIVENINQANFSLRAYINNSKHQEVAIMDLYDHCKEFVTETLSIKGIDLDFNYQGSDQDKIGSELNRDVTMCMYEITNNIIKHSSASKVSILFEWSKKFLSIKVEEHGGQLMVKEGSVGHGIKNLEKRVLRNQGNIDIVNDAEHQKMVISIGFKI